MSSGVLNRYGIAKGGAWCYSVAERGLLPKAFEKHQHAIPHPNEEICFFDAFYCNDWDLFKHPVIEHYAPRANALTSVDWRSQGLGNLILIHYRRS